MRSRVELDALLREVCPTVYYQPPQVMKFPCIKYEKSDYFLEYADDAVYSKLARYTVTYIGKNPDVEDITDKLLAIPHCSFNRRFINDNLYHDVFDLYF